jgi:hypothetical protein
MSGREEEWLADNAGAPAAMATTVLLSSCLVSLGRAPMPELVRQMLVGDRDYLMLQLRRLTLGDRVRAVVHCLACAARVDVEFNVDEVEIERRVQTAATYSVAVPGENGPRTVRFRLPNGGDQERIAGLPTEEATAQLFSMCVFHDDGPPLTAEQTSAVIKAMEERAPEVNLELDIECPECGQRSSVSFDTTAFFFQEMWCGREQLLREVHLLALAYHWSESEILSLVRPRRRTYLRLLSDAFPRERA